MRNSYFFHFFFWAVICFAPVYGASFNAFTASEYFELIQLDPVPGEVFTFSKNMAKKIYIMEDESIQTMLSGTVRSGFSLKCNDLPIPTDVSGNWKFNIPLTPRPNAVNFDWYENDVKKGSLRLLIVWKANPPSFRLKVREEGTKGEGQSLSAGREDFKILPFAIFHSNGRVVQEINMNTVSEKTLFLRIYFPPQPESKEMAWKVALFENGSATPSEISGKGRPPTDIAFSDFKLPLQLGNRYRYVVEVKVGDEILKSEDRVIQVQGKRRDWVVSLNGDLFVLSNAAIDNSNGGATATLGSNLGMGGKIGFSKLLNDIWEIDVRFGADSISYKPTSGKTFTDSSTILFSFMPGVNYYIPNSIFFVSVAAGLRHEVMLRATSTTEMLVERILLPSIDISGNANLYHKAKWEAIVQAGFTYHLSRTFPSYVANAGLGYFGRVLVNYEAKEIQPFAALSILRKKVDTSILEQTITTSQLELGVRF